MTVFPDSCWAAAPGAGSYYYGACVDSVTGESDTANNCSSGVRVDVEAGTVAAPDLVVESPSVDDASPETTDTIVFRATVRNAGDAAAAATTLRYYRSDDAMVSSSDTAVGTDAVSGLAAGATGSESISLTAPGVGTYYYGACVDSVARESDTANNCSTGVRVKVSDSGGGTDTYCRDEDQIEPGEQCDIYHTNRYFEVLASGTGCLQGGFSICAGTAIDFSTGSLTLVAKRNADDSWTIDNVEPEPD